MAQIQFSPLISKVTGSIGAVTFQESVNGSFARSRPRPATSSLPQSQLVRSTMSRIVYAWQQLSVAAQNEWEAYAKFSSQTFKKGGKRVMSGYTLFMRYNLVRVLSGLEVLSTVDFYSQALPNISPSISVTSPDFFIAVGSGANSLAYSYDGINWIGLGASIFSTWGNSAVYNGVVWVASGVGTNTLAYSTNGIDWTGAGASVFTSSGNYVIWDGTYFLAFGSGTNTQAYSTNGIDWVAMGKPVFANGGNEAAYNGSVYVAVGSGTNTLAYSSNAMDWTGLGAGVFTSAGGGICWGKDKFVAGGTGGNTLAWSTDGVNWNALGSSVFSTFCASVCWNGRIYVATGGDENTLAWSADGINWNGLGASIFTAYGTNVCWNGKMFIAAGSGTNSLAYSYDGVNWTGLGTSIFTAGGNGCFSAKAPYIIPIALPSAVLDFDFDLQDDDYFVLVKLSGQQQYEKKFNTKGLRVIRLDVTEDNPFSIASAYYSVFGVSLTPGNYINCELTLFSMGTARVFPSLYYVLQIN